MPKLKNSQVSPTSSFMASIVWLRDQALPFDLICKLNRFYEKLVEGQDRYTTDRNALIKKYASKENPKMVDPKRREDFMKEVEQLDEIEHFYRFRKKPLEINMSTIGARMEELGKPFLPTIRVVADLRGIIEFTGFEDNEDEWEDEEEEEMEVVEEQPTEEQEG